MSPSSNSILTFSWGSCFCHILHLGDLGGSEGIPLDTVVTCSGTTTQCFRDGRVIQTEQVSPFYPLLFYFSFQLL